jgi:hypothetical protein
VRSAPCLPTVTCYLLRIKITKSEFETSRCQIAFGSTRSPPFPEVAHFFCTQKGQTPTNTRIVFPALLITTHKGYYTPAPTTKRSKHGGFLIKKSVDSFVAHADNVNAILVSQDDGCVFTCSSDGSAKIWRRVYRENSHFLPSRGFLFYSAFGCKNRVEQRSAPLHISISIYSSQTLNKRNKDGCGRREARKVPDSARGTKSFHSYKTFSSINLICFYFSSQNLPLPSTHFSASLHEHSGIPQKHDLGRLHGQAGKPRARRRCFSHRVH